MAMSIGLLDPSRTFVLTIAFCRSSFRASEFESCCLVCIFHRTHEAEFKVLPLTEYSPRRTLGFAETLLLPLLLV